MNIYSYQEAFGAADKTTTAMRKAIEQWYDLYYARNTPQGRNGGQRIAYTVVGKLVKTVFGEYATKTRGEFTAKILQGLDTKSREAVQQALVGGECYLRPWVGETVEFGVIPRCNVLIFARDAQGMPTDMGTVERITRDKYYFTLLERRYLDKTGHTVIENRLYRSLNAQSLGQEVALSQVDEYAALPSRYVYPQVLGNLGLVQVKNPSLNCVDGSKDGVSVYAAATELIAAIDENEDQLLGEFRRGESRIIASADMLGAEGLQDHLFVGLDDDPQSVGITVFSPQLREQSFLNRKHEYLRNVESIIGLKRGMLSDANEAQRTATEIASSAGDFNLTVIDFQRMWEKAMGAAVTLCGKLAQCQGMAVQTEDFSVDWGNGVLYDEDKTWADYLNMVDKGLLKPEYALGWRFGMKTDTEADLQTIRNGMMPQS